MTVFRIQWYTVNKVIDHVNSNFSEVLSNDTEQSIDEIHGEIVKFQNGEIVKFTHGEIQRQV